MNNESKMKSLCNILLTKTKRAIAVTAIAPNCSALTLMCSKRRDQSGEIILVIFLFITKTLQMYVFI